MDSVEAFYEAITAFNSQDSASFEQANKWLSNFQASLFAWSVCDRILLEQRDLLACQFAAQTMRQKLLHHFFELPPTSYEPLRDSLMNHLSNFDCQSNEKHGVIITQLCLAICDLYLQVAHWTGVIAEVLSRFSKAPENVMKLLALLKTFPEEVQSNRLRIGDNRRQLLNEELSQQTNSVITFLSNVCVSCSQNTFVLKKVLECLSSWLSNPLVSTDELASSALLRSIYTLLQDGNSPNELHDLACSCVTAAFYRAENTRNHKALAQSLQMACYDMLNAYSIAVACEDYDKLHGYARIICEMSESLMESILRTPGEGLGDLKTLDMLLMLSGYHDYSLVEMTFNVWYRFSEYLYERNDQKLIRKFSPYVERYIMALYKHCRFDSDFEGVPDEDDEIIQFRYKVTDAVKDVVFIIGSDRCIEMMLTAIQEVSGGTWDETEAALFIISGIAYNLIPNGKKFPSMLLRSLVTLPTDSHPILIRTSIEIIEGATEWLVEFPECRDSCLLWVLSKASSVYFCKAAARAVESICGKFNYDFIKYFNEILGLIPILESTTTKGQDVEAAIISLLTACTSLLNGAPAKEFSFRLERLTLPYAEKMLELSGLRNNSNKLDNGCKKNTDGWIHYSGDVSMWIDRISAVFRSIQPHQSLNTSLNQNKSQNGSCDVEIEPWLEIAKNNWLAFSNAWGKNEASKRVTEHLCRSVRFLIRFLGVQSIGFVEQIVGQMVSVYQRHQHSSILYLASVIVDEYAHRSDLQDGLFCMLNVLSSHSFTLLMQPNGFRDNPETVDDLYRLAIRFIQRIPSVFFQQAVSGTFFECGIAGLSVDHVDASRSLTKFFLECLESLLKAKKESYHDAGVVGLENLLLNYGSRLISSTLQSALFCVSGSLKRDMAEIIHATGRISKENLENHLKSSLSQLPHDSGLTATSEQLQQFHQNVLAAKDASEVHGRVLDLMRLYV